MFRDHLKKITQRQNLTEEQMAAMISEIFSGTLSDALIGAFMAALATKGETFEELAGAARAMRRKAARIQVSAPAVVDTCGTGGDGSGTFNISTTTAFVVAGCGVTVAKHGNRSIPAAAAVRTSSRPSASTSTLRPNSSRRPWPRSASAFSSLLSTTAP